jgi:hypothetical protein
MTALKPLGAYSSTAELYREAQAQLKAVVQTLQDFGYTVPDTITHEYKGKMVTQDMTLAGTLIFAFEAERKAREGAV